MVHLHVCFVLVVFLSTCAASGPEVQSAPDEVWRVRHLKSLLCRDDATGLEFSPLGICFDITDGLYVVDSDHSRIYRSQAGVGTLTVFSECPGEHPDCEFIGLAVNETGGIYVSERSTGSVLELDRWGELASSAEAGAGVAGIASGRAGQVFAALGLDGGIRMLDFETRAEGLESRISYDGSDAYPVDCCVLEDGTIAVTDAFSKHVLFLSALGELRGASGGFDFASPFGVACLAGRLLLVSDSDLGLVAVFTQDGTFLFTFGKGILKTPTFLDCRDDGVVCVSDAGGMTIEVFRIEEDPAK
jgi:sugar lactone lactonase YvrE